MMLQDQEILVQQILDLLYSYDFNINKEWHIRPGVNFKFYYLGLDIGKLVFNSQITGSGTISINNTSSF